MPTKRRAAKAKPHRVTPEAIEAFRAGDELALHRALALPPWAPSPLEVSEDEAAPWGASSAGTLAWPMAVALRRELERAAAGEA